MINVSMTKRGGMRFIRIGRLTITMAVTSRAYQPLRNEPRRRKPSGKRALSAAYWAGYMDRAAFDCDQA